MNFVTCSPLSGAHGLTDYGQSWEQSLQCPASLLDESEYCVLADFGPTLEGRRGGREQGEGKREWTRKDEFGGFRAELKKFRIQVQRSLVHHIDLRYSCCLAGTPSAEGGLCNLDAVCMLAFPSPL
jgi:hypothetical protein